MISIYEFMIMQIIVTYRITINDSYQHRHYVYKQALNVFSVWKLRSLCKKGHHWSRVSNGWLHFVDLFRLSDSDIEKTIICTTLT